MTTRTPTYRYEFNDPTSPTLYGFAIPGEDMSNGHSAELAYLFDFTRRATPHRATGEAVRPDDALLGLLRSHRHTRFQGAPGWPTFGSQERVMQPRTAGHSRVVTSFDQEHSCAFWLS